MYRTPDPINVFVVEHHNEVLNILYRGIGSKKIPYENLKLLHYDAHPDLGVSNCDRNTVLNNPEKLLNETSIENWILPAIYSGHINHVVWMRPNYCHQMGDRFSQEYHVGYNEDETKMQVDMNDLYYISEGVYCSTQQLSHSVKFKLSVGPIHYTHTMCKFCYDINIQLMNSDFILDIDLDTFAPVNPFQENYTETQTYLITELYGVKPHPTAVEAQNQLFQQPYPFRLKNVRYPVKKYDGQLSGPPKGTLAPDLAHSLSTERAKQLNDLKLLLQQLQFGIIACSSQVLKLLGLYISVIGFSKFLSYMIQFEEQLQDRIRQNDNFTDQEMEMMKMRCRLKSVPQSFIRQIEELFSGTGDSCKQTQSVVQQIENIYRQMKSHNSEGYHINWLKLPKYLKRKFEIGCTSSHHNSIRGGLNEAGGSSDNTHNNNYNESSHDDTEEDLMLFYHYIFSSCGFQWNSEQDSLPHRPFPSSDSIQDTLNDMSSLLNRLHSPILITISRSADDGYIRQEIIDKVQSAVITCLERVYENKDINVIHYDPNNANFTWPTSRRNSNSTKHFNEVTVSFRNTHNKFDKKDML